MGACKLIANLYSWCIWRLKTSWTKSLTLKETFSLAEVETDTMTVSPSPTNVVEIWLLLEAVQRVRFVE